MSPWPPEGEPEGKGTKPVTVPRPGHADLAGVLKYGLTDVRDALERASARHTAVFVAAGAVAKALLREIGVEVEGSVVGLEDVERRVDEARSDRDTVGGVVEVRAGGVPPGLGSYATQGRPARRSACRCADGHPGGEGRRDRRRLRARRRSAARRRTTRSSPGLHRETNRAGGIEAGVSNGEEIVVRAAMKPLPTLMRPLQTVDLATGEPAEALVERSDTAAVEALAVVAEAAVAFELARAAREKFGGDAIGDFVARSPRVPGADRLVSPLDRHVALIGFMGAGKSTLGGQEAAERIGRPLRRRRPRDRGARGRHDRRDLPLLGRGRLPRDRGGSGRRGALRTRAEGDRARRRRARLGGDQSRAPRARDDGPRRGRPRHGLGRARGGDRPLAQDEEAFRQLYDERRPVYEEAADVVSRHADDVVLAAGGVHVHVGSLELLGELLPGDGSGRARGGRARGRDLRRRRAARARRAGWPRRTRCRAARRRRRRRSANGSGRSSGSTAAARSSRSAAAARPT